MHKFCFFALLVSAAAAAGCGVYSFRPVYISPEIKTVSVTYFQNNAPLVNPLMSQAFTEALKDIFITQSNLRMTERDGDIRLEGAITGYDVRPTAVQGNETAAMNRLTVRVKVKYTNVREEKKDFEMEFSRYIDYDSSIDFSSKEEEFIREVNSQLVQDIFDRTMINW